jgi:DNA modification methylase
MGSKEAGVIRILAGDCRERLTELDADSIHACVTDPPYHLTSIVKRFGASNAAPAKVGKTGAYARASAGFMGQQWDGGDVAFQPETWAAVYRVLKPGAHLVAFGGTRTYHRMACAIEDAGFEIRDQIGWLYGSGFPKSHDVSKGIDKMAGAQREVLSQGAPVKRMIPGADQNKAGWIKDSGREFVPTITAAATPEAEQWQGWGTAVKPAWEPIVLARKPLIGTVAANILQHGTGALNIDGCRIEGEKGVPASLSDAGSLGWRTGGDMVRKSEQNGRWPANIIHDGSEEVLAHFPETTSGEKAAHHVRTTGKSKNVFNPIPAPVGEVFAGDSGSAARFFYCAKATTEERGEGNNHPTVKPIDLMRYLCRLVTPKGGTVLDPFMGSGSTMIAADMEQFHGIGCELSPEYAAIAERRLKAAAGMFCEVQAA